MSQVSSCVRATGGGSGGWVGGGENVGASAPLGGGAGGGARTEAGAGTGAGGSGDGRAALGRRMIRRRGGAGGGAGTLGGLGATGAEGGVGIPAVRRGTAGPVGLGRGAAARRGISSLSIAARRVTNQRVSEPRSTSWSSGREAQSLTVASIPAASRDASRNPKDSAAPWIFWVSRSSSASAARSLPVAAKRSAMPRRSARFARIPAKYCFPGSGCGAGGAGSRLMGTKMGKSRVRAPWSRVTAPPSGGCPRARPTGCSP